MKTLRINLPDELLDVCRWRWPTESWSTIVATALRRQLAEQGLPPSRTPRVRTRLSDELHRNELGELVAVRHDALEDPTTGHVEVQQFTETLGQPDDVTSS